MTARLLISAFLFVTLTVRAHIDPGLESLRSAFQEVEEREDLERMLGWDPSLIEEGDKNVLMAYMGAANCMMANYVFSPFLKLEYFKEGRELLEKSISLEKNVENVYLRMLVQLHVPKILNYYEDIQGDLEYLQRHLPAYEASVSFKERMIANLSDAAKKEELKNALLQVPVAE